MLVNLTSFTELDNFFQYPAQASAPVTLDAQQPILLEAAHCNGAAAGHVQVRAACTEIVLPQQVSMPGGRAAELPRSLGLSPKPFTAQAADTGCAPGQRAKVVWTPVFTPVVGALSLLRRPQLRSVAAHLTHVRGADYR